MDDDSLAVRCGVSSLFYPFSVIILLQNFAEKEIKAE